jgi:hypothetical protein
MARKHPVFLCVTLDFNGQPDVSHTPLMHHRDQPSYGQLRVVRIVHTVDAAWLMLRGSHSPPARNKVLPPTTAQGATQLMGMPMVSPRHSNKPSCNVATVLLVHVVAIRYAVWSAITFFTFPAHTHHLRPPRGAEPIPGAQLKPSLSSFANSTVSDRESNPLSDTVEFF